MAKPKTTKKETTNEVVDAEVVSVSQLTIIKEGNYQDAILRLNDSSKRIQRLINESCLRFISIGEELDEVQREETFKVLGFKDIYEYAESTFNIKKTSTKNFISVFKTFGDKEEIIGYSFSQLVELLPVAEDEKVFEKMNSQMTTKEIRTIKRIEEICKDVEGEFIRESYSEISKAALASNFHLKGNATITPEKIEFVLTNGTITTGLLTLKRGYGHNYIFYEGRSSDPYWLVGTYNNFENMEELQKILKEVFSKKNLSEVAKKLELATREKETTKEKKDELKRLNKEDPLICSSEALFIKALVLEIRTKHSIYSAGADIRFSCLFPNLLWIAALGEEDFEKRCLRVVDMNGCKGNFVSGWYSSTLAELFNRKIRNCRISEVEKLFTHAEKPKIVAEEFLGYVRQAEELIKAGNNDSSK